MCESRNPRLVAIVLVAFFSSGCAFVDQKVGLRYEQALTSGKGKGPIEIATPVAPTLETKKKGFFIVGAVKNTYGMKTADTVTQDSIPQWIANALKTELEAAGFDVQLVNNLSRPVKRGIETRVVKVWVDQDPGLLTVGALGEVQFRMALYRGTNKVKEFDVDGRGQGSRSLIGDAETKAQSLQVALQACMKKAIPIIIETFSEE